MAMTAKIQPIISPLIVAWMNASKLGNNSIPFSSFILQVTTRTLPSPFPEGGIYDKGEGLGGGEKWDFLYYRVRVVKKMEQEEQNILSTLLQKTSH